LASEADLDLVRLYVAEPRGDGEKFSDPTLQEIIDGNGGDLAAAASAVWLIKAGNVAFYYAVNLDSANLNLGQIFTHCQAMAKYYRDQSGAELINVGMTTLSPDDLGDEFSGG
jgi:hypothetical protein